MRLWHNRLCSVEGMNSWAPNPGSTDMTSAGFEVGQHRRAWRSRADRIDGAISITASPLPGIAAERAHPVAGATRSASASLVRVDRAHVRCRDPAGRLAAVDRSIAVCNQRIPHSVLPIANPRKPSTRAPTRSHSSTFASSAPRPSTMQATLSRPPLRASTEIRSQSASRSSPSIFQMSGSTPASRSAVMVRSMRSGRTLSSYVPVAPPTEANSDGVGGTRSSNRNRRWCKSSLDRVTLRCAV